MTIPKTGTDVDFQKPTFCILRKPNGCEDDKILSHLSENEKQSLKIKLSDISKNSEDSSIRLLFRDAVHSEYLNGPESAANFLKKIVSSDDFHLNLKCWADKNFDKEIPWINQFRTGSQKAFHRTMSCSRAISRQSEFPCKCLKDTTLYDLQNYQVKSPTKLMYLNSDSDSQTPLDGAVAHFNLQTSTQKGFLKVCGGGHGLLIGPQAYPERKSVGFNSVYDAAFASDLESFKKIPNYCKKEENSELGQD